MRASGTFTVADFTPTPVPGQQVQTAIPLGIATMEKRFEGDVSGRATTLFTSAFDDSTGAGTYVAMESFDGTVHDRAGTFNFAHSKTTLGDSPRDEFFVIVPGSGAKDLTGITGTGGIRVDADGTHHIWFDYELNP